MISTPGDNRERQGYRCALPYFGSVGLWARARARGGFAFRAAETYQRRTQRNRTRIATSHGSLVLSVPLRGGKHQRCPARAVEIAYAEDWRRRHYLSVEAAYASAPFWPEYAEDLADLYAREPRTLWEWNLACVRAVLSWTDWDLRVGVVEDFRPASDAMSDPLGEDPALPHYAQVFADRHGWLSNLSVLDLVMTQGPWGWSYLSRSPTP